MFKCQFQSKLGRSFALSRHFDTRGTGAFWLVGLWLIYDVTPVKPERVRCCFVKPMLNISYSGSFSNSFSVFASHHRPSFPVIVSHPGFSFLSNLGGIEKRKMDLLASYNDENVEDSPSTVSEKQVNQFLIPSKYRFDQIVIKFHFSDPLNEIKIEPEKKHGAQKVNVSRNIHTALCRMQCCA